MQDDEQAIRNLVASWFSATKAGDGQKVLSLMADDVVFLTPGNPPMRKADFAASLAGLRQADIQATSEIQEIKLLGDWAYIWTQLSVVMTPKNGAPVKRRGTTLSILQKRAGTWLMVRDANMLAVVAQ